MESRLFFCGTRDQTHDLNSQPGKQNIKAQNMGFMLKLSRDVMFLRLFPGTTCWLSMVLRAHTQSQNTFNSPEEDPHRTQNSGAQSITYQIPCFCWLREKATTLLQNNMPILFNWWPIGYTGPCYNKNMFKKEILIFILIYIFKCTPRLLSVAQTSHVSPD